MSKLSVGLAAILVSASFSAFAATDGKREASREGDAKASRVHVVRSWPEPVTVNGKTALGHVEIAFDYDTGVVTETVFDASGQVVSSTIRRRGEGAPRPTQDEIERAMDIVRADAEISRVIDQTSAILEGGFILNEAPGKPCAPGTRCIQVQLNTADGYGFIRWVVVDLTRDSIVYRTFMPSTGEGSN